MDGIDETNLVDTSISMNNSSLTLNTEERRDPSSNRRSNISPADVSKIEPTMHTTIEQTMTDKLIDSVTHVETNDTVQTPAEIVTTKESINDNNTMIPPTVQGIDVASEDPITSRGFGNAVATPADTAQSAANQQQQQLGKSNRATVVVSVPQQQQQHISVEGNDRITFDQPPNVALVTNSSLEPPQTTTITIVADIRQHPMPTNVTTSDPTNSQPIVVVTNTNAVASTLPINTQTVGTDAGNALLTRKPPPASSSLPRMSTSGTTAALSNTQASHAVTVGNRPTSTSFSYSVTDDNVPTIQQTAQQAAEEAAIAASRAPLVNLYGSYLCHSKDTSLADARQRLRNAIAQTRSLRQTFTDRVYGKYRVCLRPPQKTDDIIANIEADPLNQFRMLKEEIATVREEKEIEKKEAAKLNNEMNQSNTADRVPVLSNIDNAEQLMFLTAGLNLVILPEEQSEEQLRAYAEAYSHSNTTGRTRSSISQAAATAGEVILDRTRKAAAMRVERQRRRQLQLLRGEVVADGESENNYSRLQVLKIAGSSTTQNLADGGSKNQSSSTSIGAAKKTQPSSRRPAAASSKRSRSQSTLPTSTLLSINPSADEIKIDGNPSAATLALIARGVGQTMAKSTQQRLRHPHPESLGGRRRANMNPVSSVRKDDDVSSYPPEPFLQSNLANTLPPLPASKERLERKRISDEYLDTPCSHGARHSVRSILQHFIGTSDTSSHQRVTKINLLNSIRKQSADNPCDSKVSGGGPQHSTILNTSGSVDATIHPSLTISVLYALGIVGRSEQSSANSKYSIRNLNIENTALCSDRLMSLKGKILASSVTLTKSIDHHDEVPPTTELSRKRTRSSNTDTAKKQDDDSSIALAAKNDVDKESLDIVVVKIEDTETAASSNITNDAVRPKKRQRSSSSPTRPSNEGLQMHFEQFQQLASSAPMNVLGTTTIGAAPTHFTQNNAMNMFQYANQLRHMHHPAAGDLAEYLGGFQTHQPAYDLPNLMTGSVASPLAVFGLMQSTTGFPGYTIQERAATARVMIVREQQAAALLGGYPLQPASAFPQLPIHPFTMSQSVPSLIGLSDIHVQRTVNADCSRSEPDDRSQEASTSDGASTSMTPPSHKQAHDESISIQKLNETRTIIDSNVKVGTAGTRSLLFVAPTIPSTLQLKYVEHIQAGLFHLVADELDASELGTAIDYLLSVGSAVPIPKALVLAPLKDRLSTPGFKSASGSSTPLITRDVVAATILVWLWATQERTFQQAFDTNGRIDVDADCKWLIQAAVDTAVGELSLEIAESIAGGEGKFAQVSEFRKTNPIGPGGPTHSDAVDATRKLDSCTAAIVSKALSTEMCINSEMNSIIPMSSLLVDFLDELRLGALRVKSQERTLLATLIARNTLLSENHAQAYVSAMVRAGEALKHGRLFEIAQDESVMASTMIPYDIFTDDTGAWEDPCKPDDGFTVGLSGDELARRAHARAIIQKSLRKLQDRHHLRGGTAISGPYVDAEGGASRTSSGYKDRPSLVPQRSGQKRRVSSMMEPPIVPGTGSASAKSWAVYHPRHISVPLEWDRDDVANLPYGLNHRRGFLSLPNRRNDQDINQSNRATGLIVSEATSDRFLSQSTSEINWVDVASTFQSVELSRKSSRYKVVEHETHVTIDGTIFAPFYQEIQGDLSTDDNDGESTDDEDLSETNILARHQVVLDNMKAKLEAYLEAKKLQQERRKNKYTK